MRIVYVHLGPYWPRWLLPNCLDQRLTLGREVVIVSDNQRLLKAANSRRLDTWEYRTSLPERTVDVGNASLSDFRSGFWVETSRRFVALRDFQEDLKEPMVHVESDVVLFPSLELKCFERLANGLAFPLVAENIGVASVLFSREAGDMSNLVQTMLTSRKRYGPVTDMQLLGLLSSEHADSVSLLPTTTPSREWVEESTVDSLLVKMSSNYAQFGGIFDAATIGQYLTGLDSRNYRGQRRIFTIPSDHTLDPSKMRFQLSGEQLMVADAVNDVEIPVHCLHVHSKDLRVFTTRERTSLLEERLRVDSRSGRIEFDAWGLVRSIGDSLNYRWKRSWG